MKVLVAGGAGYIGSHMVCALLREGHSVTTLDDFSTGRRPAFARETLLRGSIGDARLAGALLREGRFHAVLHFAARSIVPESARDPSAYWHNNVAATLVFLDALREHGPSRLVFSSTAAIYGDPGKAPVNEAMPCTPLSAYGKTKLAVEHALEDYESAHGLRSIRLRYFNAAGAGSGDGLGEHHEPETHLVPLVLQTAAGLRGPVVIHGTDYPTADGTCVRDYVHVDDLCDAHLLALARLMDGAAGGAFNLGNCRGSSVREVVESAGRFCGRPIPVRDGARRAGDPPVLVADSSLARSRLGWTPRREDLDGIIASAWCASLRKATPPGIRAA